MKYELTELDKNIIRELQKGLPISTRPFDAVSEKLDISEQELLERLKFFKEKGIIRRFGARVNHQKSGYRENIMTVWKLPEDRTEEVGTFIAGYRQVSHCYLRPELEGFPYNLYSMIHGKKEGECSKVIKDISQKTGMSIRVIYLFQNS